MQRVSKKVPWKLRSIKPFKRWKIVRGDTVEVIAGRDKGTRGEVRRVQKDRNRLVVSGVNVIKKRVPNTKEMQGGTFNLEAPIALSNVALIDPVDDKPCRVRWSYVPKDEDDPDKGVEKVRVSVRSGAVIPKNHAVRTERAYPRKAGPNDTPKDVVLERTFTELDLVPHAPVVAGLADALAGRSPQSEELLQEVQE